MQGKTPDLDRQEVAAERRPGARGVVLRENLNVTMTAGILVAICVGVWQAATFFRDFMTTQAMLVKSSLAIEQRLQVLEARWSDTVTQEELEARLTAIASRRYTAAHFDATGLLIKDRAPAQYFPTFDEVDRVVVRYSLGTTGSSPAPGRGSGGQSGIRAETKQN